MKSVDPLHGLAAFLAVSDHLSFTTAASVLGLSRATVSAQVSELESRLGVRLMHRTTRAVQLTEAGRTFRERLGDLRQRIDIAEREARALQTVPVGRLRVTAPPDLSQRFLAPWVGEFLVAHPGISIDLDTSARTVNLIEERFDLAIRGTLEVAENQITRLLGHSALYTVAAPDYIARRGQPSHAMDLVAHDLLHLSVLRAGRVWTMRRGDEQVRVPITPRLEMGEGSVLLQAALAGAGIIQLPAFVVGGEIRAGRLIPLLTDWTAGMVPLHAVYPDNRLIAERVRTFVSFLARKARAEPDLQDMAPPVALRRQDAPPSAA